MMRSELVDSLSKPAYGVKPQSARQLNAMQISFRWQADGGLLLDVYCVSCSCCHVVVSVLFLFLVVPCVGLLYAIVAFHGYPITT